ncbi:MAG: hypothetical protein KAT43_05235 [Nanoarchaeota archaeon]|nr:hypothetical protein [Nanoarchaeota archaeon]
MGQGNNRRGNRGGSNKRGSGRGGDRDGGFNRGGSRDGGGFNRGGGGGFNRDPKKMHKAICAECHKECEVPFKPTEGKPVYCKECFEKRKH